MFEVVDDGTLDTVVRCQGCGEEARYNYADGYGSDGFACYDEFVDWALDDAEEQHECT